MSLNFFVYGTLKVGGFFARNFDEHRISVVKGEVKNMDLFSLGSFPTIKEGKGKVIGEIHQYDFEQEILEAFDRIEGYKEGKEEHSLYLRKEIDVETEDKKTVKAIIYVLNGDLPYYARKIKSGIWNINNKGE